ncbi:MAG: HAMP domain-containing histidine kinase [Chitinophagaceae bacterium]|nr:HAMP domain-containing histidine kinase [Chitinophagaceae bacterium]
MNTILHAPGALLRRIRNIGVTPSLDDYEKRKLAIFNILNCMGIMNGIIIPVAGLFNDDNLPPLAWVVAVSPVFISTCALIGIHYRRYELAKMTYFILYPLLTALAYATQIDIGIELFFFVYGTLGVFLMKNIWHAIVAFGFSALMYLSVFVVWNNYESQLADLNPAFFVFNHILAVVFIFASLYLFKSENQAYLLRLKVKNDELAVKKDKIEKQRTEIAGQVALLEKQTAELKELDGVKNKLFSVIAHDLKTPMYALRNLFRNMQQHNLSGEEIKMMLPDVVTDLNYTTGLMENLLHWAKSQMQADAMNKQRINVSELIREVMQLLRLQAESKRVYLENKADGPVYIYADKDMVNLVLRNLLSNAIKFTPENGYVFLGASESDEFVEVFVQDTGRGMNDETMKKINSNSSFTTKGTANETGTGLGLMLCKEFLAKNDGRMFVESVEGKGSTFSFTLPAASDN